jgi:hypothetical protein
MRLTFDAQNALRNRSIFEKLIGAVDRCNADRMHWFWSLDAWIHFESGGRTLRGRLRDKMTSPRARCSLVPAVS